MHYNIKNQTVIKHSRTPAKVWHCMTLLDKQLTIVLKYLKIIIDTIDCN